MERASRPASPMALELHLRITLTLSRWRATGHRTAGPDRLWIKDLHFQAPRAAAPPSEHWSSGVWQGLDRGAIGHGVMMAVDGRTAPWGWMCFPVASCARLVTGPGLRERDGRGEM